MIAKIAFIGGPASGKTTVHDALRNRAAASDVNVIFVPEVASAMLSDRPPYIEGKDNIVLRQYYIYRAQLLMERLAYQEAAGRGPDADTLILCDRGCLDIFVYLSELEAASALRPEEKLGPENPYDAALLFYPPNVCYSLDNNAARLEDSAEEGLRVCDRTERVWRRYFKEKIYEVPPCPDVESRISETAAVLNMLVGKRVFC